jgi:hypothetical protein
VRNARNSWASSKKKKKKTSCPALGSLATLCLINRLEPTRHCISLVLMRSSAYYGNGSDCHAVKRDLVNEASMLHRLRLSCLKLSYINKKRITICFAYSPLLARDYGHKNDSTVLYGEIVGPIGKS